MYKYNGFTQKANNSIKRAVEIACELGHTFVGSEHLIFGLVTENGSVAQTLLERNNVNRDFIKKKLKETFGVGVKSNLGLEELTPKSKKIIENAIFEAQALGHNSVGTEHLLLSILKEEDCSGVVFLKEMQINIGELYEKCIQEISNSLNDDYFSALPNFENKSRKEKPKNPLTDYGKNLNELSKQNKFDPVIGRDEEVERIIQILCRRTKNNPCLVGEPGVGKTAIVEGLVQKIVSGEVPDIIKNKKIINLDISGMLAGAKYRGDFEDRMKKVLAATCQKDDVILFIDEIHIIIGAGAAEGAIDAANILKPQLARGEIQVIGATTNKEYKRYIEKDSALERRFQPVLIEEPTKEDTVKILFGLKDKYEKHHGLKISEEAIKAAVALSARYITDRYLPDKAIDLVDEAAAMVKIKSLNTPNKIKSLQKKLQDISSKKEMSINTQDFESAMKLKNEEEKTNKLIEMENLLWKEKKNKKTENVSKEDIAQIVSNTTGIQLSQINQKEIKKLLNMEKTLHEYVVGQNEAIKSISNAIRRSRVGISDPNKPIASFLFLGPTGVGKTKLCIALSSVIFGTEDAIIRLDMSEYMEKHTVSKIIGSPPGYVGYEDGGQLTEKIRKKPYSILLLDEIEKAHPDIFNLLLQILEDGVLTDSQGRKVDFKNTAIILTSNIGAKILNEKQNFGFNNGNDMESNSVKKKDVLNELKTFFKPEFLNRLDEIIVFKKLNMDEVRLIAQNLMDGFLKRAKALDIDIKVDNSVIDKIAELGYDPIYGARPLKRIITKYIENNLSQNLLDNTIKRNDSVLLNIVDGEFKFICFEMNK